MSADPPIDTAVLVKIITSISTIFSTLLTLAKLRGSGGPDWAGVTFSGPVHKALIITLLIAIGAFQVTVFLKPKEGDPVVVLSVTSSLSIVLLLVMLILSWRENARLAKMFEVLHRRISHSLRNKTRAVIRDGIQTSPKDELNQERLYLNEICQAISIGFGDLIKKPCEACITLIDPDSPKDERTCFVWAHSAGVASHRLRRAKPFTIKENTRFSYIAERADNETTLAFFSTNLLKYPEYKDEMPGWKKYYRATIVVPIRCFTKGELSEIGYLKLETFAVNRLNGQSHVEILASIADQIFSFLDVIRLRRSESKTTVRVRPEVRKEA